MSDYALDDSPSAQQQQPGNDATSHNISVDDQNAANNSIIGKVKSRVSSILPNSLSKWFSPSSKMQSDTYNGTVSTPTNLARRRRRIEVDDDDENYDEDEVQRGEYEENHNLITKKEDNSEEEDEEEDDDSQKSEEEYKAKTTTQKERHIIHGRQPPAKRSRLNTDTRDSPLITSRQPLVASTPAVGSSCSRNDTGNNSTETRTSYQRLTNLNLYGKTGNKEPPYSFEQQHRTVPPKTNADIIDLISAPSHEASDKLFAQWNLYSRSGVSSRRSLNIASSTTGRAGAGTMTQLNRQPLSSSKADSLSPGQVMSGVPPRRTSTTILETKDFEEQSEQEDEFPETTIVKYNGQIFDKTSNLGSQRQAHINGSGFNPPDVAEEHADPILDTGSESGESGTAFLPKSSLQKPLRKSGLFNTNLSVTGSGSITTRNSSRTSSFGNGLNFYSHLEGKKSLFTGPTHISTNQLNNSTLSLTSLNRRQFNASIYGSTSALSDSRLLNTFSPFYKGKTTYGGAAAYNKYSAGAGASAVRITPTLIRPTSSLSLSSSTSSLVPNCANNQQVADGSTISSTAKRILDLINDFATPLSDAKKMANNLKLMPAMPHSKGRLNENDLRKTRAMRLSQVRTPYARPSVILQPSGNANSGGEGAIGGPMPPVKELQVPTMSQLLQMKKIQTTTENVRNITRDTIDNNHLAEYSLPVTDNNDGSKTSVKSLTRGLEAADQQQQKHKNKMKNKVSNTMRASVASKDLHDEAPPPSINLPTLAFPLMQSVPKFDIHFSSVAGTTSTLTATTTTGGVLATTKAPTTKSAFNTNSISLEAPSNPSSVIDSLSKPCKISNTTSTSVNFKFSEPITVEEYICTPITHNTTSANVNNYTFSPPLEVTTPKPTETQQPQLKTSGSCLDVFSKPISSAAITVPITTATFGDMFKKSASNWECETCLISNESVALKCVACETPRKEKRLSEKSAEKASENVTPMSSTFGQQFKKSSSEWECDVCMIRNKNESSKCVACETPRKVSGYAAAPPSTVSSTQNTFGDAFKSKSETWECPTCMIRNKIDICKCVACETKKPGTTTEGSGAGTIETSAANTFKFGFSTPQISSKEIKADSGFQSIVAQQKASKWECDACMTRNDSERTKCACCEQPKPGSNASDNSSAPAVSTFSFGATAAAKFSFGFGTSSNAAKEEDLRKENDKKGVNAATTVTATLHSETSKKLPVAGVQFGFTPNTPPAKAQENRKDEVDSEKTDTSVKSKATVGFELDAINNDDEKQSQTTNPPKSGFVFGSVSSVASSTESSKTIATPTVAFSLTPTSSNTSSSTDDKSSGVGEKAFSFGSNSAATSTTEELIFGTNKKEPTTLKPAEDKKTLEGFAFKTPAAVSSSTTTGFVFGTTTALSSSQTAPITTTTTTTSTVAVSTAAVKPMFSFGSSAPISKDSTTTSAAGFGGFTFGSSSASKVTEKTFGAVTSTSSATTTTDSTSSANAAPASTTNMFGSFAGKPTPSVTFGSSSAVASTNPTNSSTTVSSSTNSTSASAKPTFGSFGCATPAQTNLFGSFGSSNSHNTNQVQNKPVASVLGNAASSSGIASSSNINSFVFGSAAATTSAPATTTTAACTSSWPKNNFVFGSGTPTTTVNTTQSTNLNKEAQKSTVFGAFDSGTSNTSNQQQAKSIFGNPSPAFSNTLPTNPAFGSAPGSSTTNTTGSNLFATATPTPVASNIFGANHSGNAATPAPAFGTPPFGGGGSALSTNVTPTFGSTAMTGSSASFSGFGGTAISTASNQTTNGPETKKPEQAFNFGSAAPVAQSTSGGLNFGSSSSTAPAASKAAFNFVASTASQPAFNFTGSSESQNSAKPFQFGAIPTAQVFNFSGGAAIEATRSAPFQFNAGTAPVSSNIFAPAPTPGTQTAQQAKRKIRAPIRRVTQR